MTQAGKDFVNKIKNKAKTIKSMMKSATLKGRTSIPQIGRNGLQCICIQNIYLKKKQP